MTMQNTLTGKTATRRAVVMVAAAVASIGMLTGPATALDGWTEVGPGGGDVTTGIQVNPNKLSKKAKACNAAMAKVDKLQKAGAKAKIIAKAQAKQKIACR